MVESGTAKNEKTLTNLPCPVHLVDQPSGSGHKVQCETLLEDTSKEASDAQSTRYYSLKCPCWRCLLADRTTGSLEYFGGTAT